MGIFGTRLTRAIRRGMKPDADLVAEIRRVGQYSIRSRVDALAIVDALRNLEPTAGCEDSWNTPLARLASLFQDVESDEVPAFPVLEQEGIQELLRWYDLYFTTNASGHSEELLSMLKIFAAYGSEIGCQRIVQAAKLPLFSDSYWWNSILNACTGANPNRQRVIRELSDSIPPAFIGVSLLDAGNSEALNGGQEPHPFDNAAGVARLREWLEDRDPERFSYAHSATAALPFLTHPERDELLGLAMEHPDADVRIEAAWAGAKLEQPDAIRLLVQYSLDIRYSKKACQYLTELGSEDQIPPEIADPTFQARSEFAQWLAHPNELGAPPAEVITVDSRELNWPGNDGPCRFWWLQFRHADETGLEPDQVDCGLVGSMTWCFFSWNMNRRPPEDGYAIHCAWEMQNADLIQVSEVTDPREYAHLLRHIQPESYQACRMVNIAEVSPKLGKCSRLVAIAEVVRFEEGKKSESSGWIVVDGKESRWYSSADFPEDEPADRILSMYIGSKLLGIDGTRDRQRYLAIPVAKISDEQIVDKYESLLAELETASSERIAELLGRFQSIHRHFDTYLNACSRVRQEDRGLRLIQTYDRWLQAAERLPESYFETMYDSFSTLGEAFMDYVSHLPLDRRKTETVRLMKRFEPYWNHNLGSCRLGNAAYIIEDWSLAEKYFLKYKEGADSYVRSEEMSLLATIWFQRGNAENAKELLMECLVGMLKEIRESEYNSDRKMFAEEYAFHRQTLIKLFPDAPTLLAQYQLPDDPLALV